MTTQLVLLLLSLRLLLLIVSVFYYFCYCLFANLLSCFGLNFFYLLVILECPPPLLLPFLHLLNRPSSWPPPSSCSYFVSLSSSSSCLYVLTYCFVSVDMCSLSCLQRCLYTCRSKAGKLSPKNKRPWLVFLWKFFLIEKHYVWSHFGWCPWTGKTCSSKCVLDEGILWGFTIPLSTVSFSET